MDAKLRKATYSGDFSMDNDFKDILRKRISAVRGSSELDPDQLNSVTGGQVTAPEGRGSLKCYKTGVQCENCIFYTKGRCALGFRK